MHHCDSYKCDDTKSVDQSLEDLSDVKLSVWYSSSLHEVYPVGQSWHAWAECKWWPGCLVQDRMYQSLEDLSDVKLSVWYSSSPHKVYPAGQSWHAWAECKWWPGFLVWGEWARHKWRSGFQVQGEMHWLKLGWLGFFGMTQRMLTEDLLVYRQCKIWR